MTGGANKVGGRTGDRGCRAAGLFNQRHDKLHAEANTGGTKDSFQRLIRLTRMP